MRWCCVGWGFGSCRHATRVVMLHCLWYPHFQFVRVILFVRQSSPRPITYISTTYPRISFGFVHFTSFVVRGGYNNSRDNPLASARSKGGYLGSGMGHNITNVLLKMMPNGEKR